MRITIEQREASLRGFGPCYEVIVSVAVSQAAQDAIARLRMHDTVLVERPLARRPDGSIVDMSLRLSTLLRKKTVRMRCAYADQVFDIEDEMRRSLRNLPGLDVRFEAATAGAESQSRGALADAFMRLARTLGFGATGEPQAAPEQVEAEPLPPRVAGPSVVPTIPAYERARAV